MKAKKVTNRKSLTDNDMWVLLLSTIRYSLGRSSYMVSLAPELVITYHQYLTEDQLQQVIDEITIAVRRDKISCGESWEKYACKLRDLLVTQKVQKRKKEPLLLPLSKIHLEEL